MKQKIKILLSCLCLGMMLTGCGREEQKLQPAQENDKIMIANMSGKNIASLSVVFSHGDFQYENILGDEKLDDGAMFEYQMEDMAELKKASNLTLTVNAKNKKDEAYEFGTLNITDPTGMVLVLTKNQDGYYMYLK